MRVDDEPAVAGRRLGARVAPAPSSGWRDRVTVAERLCECASRSMPQKKSMLVSTTRWIRSGRSRSVGH